MLPWAETANPDEYPDWIVNTKPPRWEATASGDHLYIDGFWDTAFDSRCVPSYSASDCALRCLLPDTGFIGGVRTNIGYADAACSHRLIEVDSPTNACGVAPLPSSFWDWATSKLCGGSVGYHVFQPGKQVATPNAWYVADCGSPPKQIAPPAGAYYEAVELPAESFAPLTDVIE